MSGVIQVYPGSRILSSFHFGYFFIALAKLYNFFLIIEVKHAHLKILENAIHFNKVKMRLTPTALR